MVVSCLNIYQENTLTVDHQWIRQDNGSKVALWMYKQMAWRGLGNLQAPPCLPIRLIHSAL